MDKKWHCCPVCGSTDIGLWNAKKKTFHCHECNNYWTKYGTIIRDTYRPSNHHNSGSGWNGFSDPDDFPTDGFDGGGW